ncbi:phage tail protein I [Pseudomonas aeruginosa]|uniref:phage tail protein I n=1 Tax=Pseudomonas aeruginosa TaxID=287 RepID=UPI001BCA2C08|nr:phage tail protein I [Pseudomonas aeruginosa]
MSDEAPRLSVLPPNRSLLEAGLDLAFDKLLERVQPPFPALMDPQATPVEFLPYLAADRGVTDWNPESAESERRATTALAWAIKRQAGTRRALVHAVESMELAAKVTSWHELQPSGVPYSFTVEATVERPWLIGDFPRLWRRLNDAKSERDNLELVLVHETSGGLRAAAAAGTPMAIGDLELDGALPDLDLQGSLGAVTAAREFTINDYDLEAPTT